MRRARTLPGFLLLALYVGAFFAAPLAHGRAGEEPHHPPFDRHEPTVSTKASAGAPEGLAACPVCQWYTANRASAIPALPRPGAPSATGRLGFSRRDEPARSAASPPSARSPPLA